MTKKHEPTAETRSNVKALASVGTTQEHIAIYLDIDVKTLRKHYRRELDTALILANQQVASSLFNQAVKEKNVTAQIFWLKTKGGWKETQVVDNTSSDGSMTPKQSITASEFTKIAKDLLGKV